MTLDKNRTYTPKEALDADPNWTTPVKLGRGRMPKGGDEHVRTLVAQGYRIKGYNATSTPTAETAPKVTKDAAAGVKVIAEIVYTYPENEWKAVDVVTGKVLGGKWMGMREVCNTCRVSLVAHGCDNPTILGGKAVRLVRR